MSAAKCTTARHAAKYAVTDATKKVKMGFRLYESSDRNEVFRDLFGCDFKGDPSASYGIRIRKDYVELFDRNTDELLLTLDRSTKHFALKKAFLKYRSQPKDMDDGGDSGEEE